MKPKNSFIQNAFKHLFEQSKNAEAIFDVKGNLIVSNSSWNKTWFLSEEESEDSSKFNLFESKLPSLQLIGSKVKSQIQTQNQHQFQYWTTDATGQKIFIHLNVRFLNGHKNLEYVLVICEDQTKRRLAESRFKRFSQISNEGIVIHDKGIIKEANDAIIRMFGFENESDAVGKHLLQFVKKTEHSYVTQLLQQKDPPKYETIGIKKNHDEFPIEVSAKEIDIDGSTMRVAILKDISKYRKSQETLFDTTERLKLASEVEPIGHFFWVFSRQESVQWDEEMHRLFELDPLSEVDRNIHFSEMLHPDDKEEIQAKFAEGLNPANPNNTFRSEFRIILSDQQTRYIESIARHYRNDTGEVIKIVGSCRDITERKLAENKLKNSEMRFREMADLLPLAIFECALNTRVNYANREAFELFGYDQHDLEKGLYGIDLVETNYRDKIKELIERPLLGAGLGASKFIAVTKENKSFPVLMYFSPIESNEEVIGFRGVIVDISLQVEAEEKAHQQHQQILNSASALEKSNLELKEALKQAQKSKELQEALEKLKAAQSNLIEQEKMASIGILTAGVAHEVNNPLNFIHGGTLAIKRYILDETPEHMEELKPLFEMIDSGVERASKIVNSLNRFNRKSDKMNEVCEINTILDNCLNILNNKLKHKISISKDFDTNKLETIGNEGKLHQVFMNILSNAEQAITDHGEIIIKTSLQDRMIKVSIQDTGTGIQEEDLSMVMEPFFTTKEPGTGTGLGMSLSNNIVQEHKGSIKYYSVYGEGTRVVVLLPIG